MVDTAKMDCKSIKYHFETEDPNPDKLVELLKSKRDNLPSEDLDDGLFLAAVQNHLECAAVLIEYGAHLESRRNGRDAIFSNLDLESDFFFCCNLTPLMMASRMGHSNFVRFLIDNGADLSSVDSFGKTALMIAIKNNHEDCTKLLVENGSELEKSDTIGHTPLNLAAKQGLGSIVKLLVSQGCSVNNLNKFNSGALHSSAAAGHLDIAKWLIDNGATADIENNDGCTPLLIALQNGHEETAAFLTDQTFNIDSVDRNGDTALICSARKGLKLPIEALVKKDCNVNIRNNLGHTPIELAVYFGQGNIVPCLVENGADMNITGENCGSLLVNCILRKHLDIAKYLIEKDCLLDGALIAATKVNMTDLVRIILDKEPDSRFSEAYKQTALHVAAELGFVDIVNMLIEANFDMDAFNSDGRTPLMLAIKHGKKNVVNSLVREGCDLDVQATEMDKECALGIAATFGRPASIKLLVENGADMNLRNSYNCVPLHLAIANDLKASATVLIQNDCQLDVFNHDKETPLACAVLKGMFDITKEMVRHGCNINLQSGRLKRCPLHIALLYKHVDIAKYLIECGADINIKDEEGNNALVFPIKNLMINLGGKTISDYAASRYVADNDVREMMDLFRLLIKRGCPINEQNIFKESVLHYAACCNQDVVEIVLQNGADPNLQCKGGYTALFTPLKYGCIESFELMLQHGADPNCMDIVGFKASKTHFNNNPKRLQFCKLLIRYGLRTDLYPTHPIYPGLLMDRIIGGFDDELANDQAIRNIALLSGSSSHKSLYSLLKDDSKTNLWESYPEKLLWLEAACSTPLTLLNLSRITILKKVNQKPTKVKNIKELTLPQSLKDFLDFSDF